MSQPVLDYAPAPRYRVFRWVYRHRRVFFFIALSLLLLGVVIFVNREWLGACWGQAMHLRAQNRISHQVLPAGTVIFTEDPARIAALASAPGYRIKPFATPGLPAAVERAYGSSGFSALDSGSGKRASFQVDDTFCYLRTSAGGIPWIVKLDQVNPYAGSARTRKAPVTQAAIAPVGWTPGARGVCVSFMSHQILLEATDILTFFAPQPDAADASCVIIPYELNGKPGSLAAIVSDKGYIQFSVRSGSAKLVKWNAP